MLTDTRVNRPRLALCLLVLLLIPLTTNAQDVALGLDPTPSGLYQSFRVLKPNPVPRETTAAAARTSTGIDLSPWLPEPGYQGNLGSCVTWAVGYAVRSYQENIERGWGTDNESRIFSPSFLYNQVAGGRNVGTSFQASFAILMEDGIATWRTMPYTTNLRVRPSPEAFQEAAQYKAKSFERVNVAVPDIKLMLDQGRCVLFGMEVYANFEQYRGGVYRSVQGGFRGGHAMVVVGYDDRKSAFKIMNSWSTRWGEDGFGWIDYDVFTRLTKEAYVLHDIVEVTPPQLTVPVGLEASRGAYTGTVQVRWDHVENAVGYEVLRKDPEAEDFRQAARTRGPLFVDRAVEPEVRYIYAVRAVNEHGASEVSDVAVGWAAAPKPLPPGPPQNLAVRIQGGAIYLRWDAVEKAEQYSVYRWDHESEVYRAVGRSRDQGFSETLEEMPPATLLYYIVTASNQAGESKASDAVSIKTPEPEPEPEPVPEPREPEPEPEREPLVPPRTITLDVGPRGRGIALSWDAVPGAEWYIVLRWSNPRAGWRVIERRASETRLVDSSGDRDDYYLVVSANRGGFSELSAFFSLSKQAYKESLTFEDEQAGYYEDPTVDRFFEGELFSDDQIFPVGDRDAFRGQYFDDGVFDEETISRFYAFFSEKRQAFEEARSQRREEFESRRDQRRGRFDSLLGN